VSLLTWLIYCALTVRSTVARMLEAATDASVMLPAGLSTILIIFLFATRAQAYPAGDQTETTLGGHIGTIVLPYDVTAAAPAGHVFDLVESCKAAMATLATSQPSAPADIRFCWDSGCTCYCIPTEDMWMLDSVTDPKPNIGVEVASSTILMVQAIGTINSTFPPKLVCDSEFRRRSVDEEGQQELCRVTVAHVHHGREPMRPGGGHRRADVRVHPLAEELVAGRGRLSTGLHPSLSSSAVRRRAPAWGA
jgi:hypothetical protein